MNENKNNWLKDIEKWNQEIVEKSQKEHKKNQYRKWGKLGGRPKKGKEKLSEKMLISFSIKQKQKLDFDSNSYGIKPQEYIRNLVENKNPKDAERNKILLEVRTHFKRIGNHFRSNVWSFAEKEEYKAKLDRVISLIENELNK